MHDYSLLDGLAHRVTTELPERTGTLGHLTRKNPFTDEVSNESFPEVYDRALVDYECTVARYIATGDMDVVTSHVNYSGRVLEADEEFDREELGLCVPLCRILTGASGQLGYDELTAYRANTKGPCP